MLIANKKFPYTAFSPVSLKQLTSSWSDKLFLCEEDFVTLVFYTKVMIRFLSSIKLLKFRCFVCNFACNSFSARLMQIAGIAF